MGLSPRAAWYSAAVLFSVGGILVMALYLLTSGLFPSGLFYLGGAALLIGALSLAAGVRLIDSETVMWWTLHARLSAGLAIYAVAMIVVGKNIVAFALIPLLTVLTPCYLYSWRFALPYVAAATTIVCLMIAGFAGPPQAAHAVVSASALVMIALSLILTKEWTRRLAVRNRQLAYTDPLTGIGNMRCLREHLNSVVALPADEAMACALFAMDLDNFKQVNDTFDHSRGDEVLCAVATAISSELRSKDLAARRGGDEFAVLITDVGGRDLHELTVRLERAIANARRASCPQITPTGSVAYVDIGPGETIGALMERADLALHEAKLASRRRRQLREARPPSPCDSEILHEVVPEAEREPADVVQDLRPRSPLTAAARAIGAAFEQTALAWNLASLLFAVITMVMAIVVAGGMVAPLPQWAGGAAAACTAALAFTCNSGARRDRAPGWLHLPWLAGYAVLAATIAAAHGGGVALVDLVPAMVLYGFLLFGTRTAFVYMLLGQGLYAALAVSGGFAQGTVRAVVTTVIVAAVGGLVARLRRVSINVSRTNAELSETDALTGLANRRAIEHRLTRVVERAAASRELQPMLLAIDLDDFKSVNDLHSHTAGDETLIAVGRAISEHVRTSDLVARRGGDEFAVVIDDGRAPDADALVARIREAISIARRKVCPELRSTASIAWVPWRTGMSYDEFLHYADIALHTSKENSRVARAS